MSSVLSLRLSPNTGSKLNYLLSADLTQRNKQNYKYISNLQVALQTYTLTCYWTKSQLWNDNEWFGQNGSEQFTWKAYQPEKIAWAGQTRSTHDMLTSLKHEDHHQHDVKQVETLSRILHHFYADNYKSNVKVIKRCSSQGKRIESLKIKSTRRYTLLPLLRRHSCSRALTTHCPNCKVYSWLSCRRSFRPVKEPSSPLDANDEDSAVTTAGLERSMQSMNSERDQSWSGLSVGPPKQ